MAVLDVGCGAFPQGDVNLDVDIRTAFHHNTYVLKKDCVDNLVLGVGEFLPFRDKSFDVVYSSHVIEHVQNPVLFLKELIRVASKKVIVKCPHRFMNPQAPSHINFLNVKWFRRILKDYLIKTEVSFKPWYGIPFLTFPWEIAVEVNVIRKVS